MKKIRILLLASVALATGWVNQGEAAVVVLGGPGIALNYCQPIQAIIIDSNGNTFQQTVYYDPAIGGVDLNTAWAGPNASVYFPAFGTGYVWYNGYWVDRTGYYWNAGRRIYIGHPNWGNYWVGYWHGRPHWDGGWYVGWHDNWHGGWHGRPEVSYHIHETVYKHGYHHHH
jgi:hypothetical protein